MRKRILVVRKVEVLTPGCEVGEQLGSPVQLTSEGAIQGAIELLGELQI